MSTKRDIGLAVNATELNKEQGTHACRVIFDDSVAARKWGVWCEQCQKLIGACQSQADAESVGENHTRWKALAASFARTT